MKFRWLLLLLFLLPSVSIIAQDDDAEMGTCEAVLLVDGWARAVPEGSPTSAIYGLVVNLSGMDDALIGGSTDAAEFVEIHESMVDENDVMRMRPLEDGLPVTAGKLSELMPGGNHIMLINLTRTLNAGDMLDITLMFETAGEVTVTVPVQEGAMMDMDMSHDHDHGDGEMGESDEAHDHDHGAGEMGESDDMGMDMMDMHTVMVPDGCEGLYVLDVWARPVMPGMPTGAAYGLILNFTDVDETLVGGSTEIAEVVEIHEMAMDGDMMRMRPMADGLTIGAGEIARLQPGGFHVMMINVTEEVEPEDAFGLTLSFAEAGDLEFTVPVRDPQAAMMMGDG